MNAKGNPFRTEQIHRIGYRLLEGSWDGLLEKLEDLDYYAAIVGPDGSGKTTLLEHLGDLLAGRRFAVKRLHLSEKNPSIPRSSLDNLIAHLTDSDIILFDGADLMSRLAWSRFERRASKAAGLIITSNRRGMLPTLIECRTTQELLKGIVAELMGGEEHGIDLAGLFDRHEGNVRSIFRELYDTFAGAPH